MALSFPLLVVSLTLPLVAVAVVLLRRRRSRHRLPPGPAPFPILGNLPLLWRQSPSSSVEPLLRRLYSTYGPIVTLHLGHRPVVFVASRHIAHGALVHSGNLFSDRPAPRVPFAGAGARRNITSSSCGPFWRLLRRNLAAGVLHPARVRSFSQGRKWVLQELVQRLHGESGGGATVEVRGALQDAMFSLLLLMCFGERLDGKVAGEIVAVQRSLTRCLVEVNVFNMLPEVVVALLFRKRWKQYMDIRRRQEEVLLPVIKSRKGGGGTAFVSYLETLLELELAEEGGRRLDDVELVALCSEFLVAGVDTSSTALEWIMANVVNHRSVQEKLVEEIESVAGEDPVEEDDLLRMPYLKATVLEGLRRHPPAHFVLPHAASTEGAALGGYAVPKDATLNFAVAEMGWDPKVWEDPMEFRPERFAAEAAAAADVTGGREIKMMPFGVGRRMCPAHGLAMLHLEYLLANLVGAFEWSPAAGEDAVDLSETQRFSILMKKPLRAEISPRTRRGKNIN